MVKIKKPAETQSWPFLKKWIVSKEDAKIRAIPSTLHASDRREASVANEPAIPKMPPMKSPVDATIRSMLSFMNSFFVIVVQFTNPEFFPAGSTGRTSGYFDLLQRGIPYFYIQYRMHAANFYSIYLPCFDHPGAGHARQQDTCGLSD